MAEGYLARVEVCVYPSDAYDALERRLKADYRGAHDGKLPPWVLR